MDITINVRISSDERLLGVLEEVLHGSVHRAVDKVKEGIATPAAPMAAPAVAPSPSDSSIPAAAPEAAPGAPERVRQVMAATRERLGATPGTPMYGVLNKLFLDIANSVGGVRPHGRDSQERGRGGVLLAVDQHRHGNGVVPLRAPWRQDAQGAGTLGVP